MNKNSVKNEQIAGLNHINIIENINDIMPAEIIFFFINLEDNNAVEMLNKLKSSFHGTLCIIPENLKTLLSEENPIDLSGLNIINFPELTFTPFTELLPGKYIGHKKTHEIINLLKEIGYNTVLIKNVSGINVLDRFQANFFSSGIQLINNGFDKKTIDGVLKFRFGFTHGIFQLMDVFGIDKVFGRYASLGLNIPDIPENMYNAYHHNKDMINGFRNYIDRTSLIPEDDIYDINPYDVISPVINLASFLVKYVKPADLDMFLKQDYGSQKGIFSMADSIGINNIVENLDKNYKKYRLNLYKPCGKLLKMVNKKNLGTLTGTGFYKYNSEIMDFGPVKYRSVDNYAHILMDRPETLNALNDQMWEGLRLALERANSDDNVLSIIITGSGRAFSSGDDIRMMENWQDSIDASLWLDHYANPLIDEINSTNKPIISIVDGIAFGGGCELNMLFDIVIASDRSVFSVPEGLIGALPPIASSHGISLMGRRLFRYLLTSEWINARTARDIGIVDLVVPAEQLPFMIYEFTEKIRRNSPMSIKNTKKIINEYKIKFRGLERLAGNYLAINASSQDFKNAQRAFINKEKIKWRGK
ncbi:hypothetical protein SE19_00365 [Acidiplasma aeolicum]|uniref:3-hydroxyacyl-CoA dehydrogenase C-terminal domain-containing protein n=2 Tax=Acidiplasma TaxID=507753 RepID=A0A0Q1B5B3_9ARCH|nr:MULTISPECIES: enoyl-CoA hydratase-related protein [Acidiplasma]KPV47599.1 hypothetical protein SE19_00365 [Acidiplasma aeolicum]KQB34526.1 hypothetical protein AOG54_04530 [Acidiplasma aeolicum]KQB35213.1 hypothetical protein AOG55_07435 [Acidiplasma cupricumulans]